jgi:predicted enzyme related to lactoylglutathione lyase
MTYRPDSPDNGAALEMLVAMQKNTVSHFEIYANDPDKLSHFYTSLFDWHVEHMPNMDYWVVRTVDVDENRMPKTPGAVNGGFARRPHGYGVNGSVNYVMVDSIEKYVEKAKHLGAKLTKDKTAVPGMGWFAMFTDPEGNHFAVFKNDQTAK